MNAADNFIQDWLRHRQVVIELLDQIEDEHIHYKPWDGAMSLGEQAVHIAGAMNMFIRLVKTGSLEFPAPVAFNTMEEVRHIVRTLTDQNINDLKELTSEQLEQMITFNRAEAPGLFWLNNAKDHEVHHKGQLFVYARMVGLEKLPFFISNPVK